MTNDDWRSELRSCVPLYGHRNWIVIADAAYPVHSSSGIRTLVTKVDQLEVIREVLRNLAASAHIAPLAYTDRELSFIDEPDAPGVSDYRERLAQLLRSHVHEQLPHEEIIGKLDEASHSFCVLIIKTQLTIPYTSVFLQLQCGYWTSEAESRLRQRMAGALTDRGR